jgi:hypothetical protein
MDIRYQHVIFFVGIDIQYLYPSSDGYMICESFLFNTLSKISIFQFPSATCCLVLKIVV